MAFISGDANYDETKVASYTLPDPLTFADGAPVASARVWRERRRQEIVRLFEEHVYGRSPGPATANVAVTSEGAALGGAAIRREVALRFTAGGPALNLLIYVPRAGGPAAAFLGANFLGNHTIDSDPGITLPDIVFAAGMDVTLPEGRATEASRGLQADRWPVERIVERGHALATFWYGDLFPDRPDGRPLSIQPHLAADDCSWGAIATWAWAMSRALDYLETAPDIDAKRVALIGHSRIGKASLWAAALDPRFWLVVANNSGKGGASLARRNYGETIRHLTTRYPHWFGPAYAGYADREALLPVDQHMLIALIAPRPIYVASASEDRWADPKGEFLAALAADPVYRLLGTDGLPAAEQPEPGRPVMGTIGYHLRLGSHGITAWDWECYLDFADRHLV